MSPRSAICILAILLVFQSTALAQGPKKEAELSLNDIALEINAYQTLKQFEFSYAQMQQLQKWAKETAQKETKREPAKTSKEYAEKLRELHKALVDNSDDERIDQIEEDLEELREKEKPAVDDGVDITGPARKRAAETFRSLKPAQLGAYLGRIAEDVPDPFDRLKAAIDEVRPLQGAEWKAKRDEVAEEVSRLVAGLDQKKADKVNDDVVALLSRAHALKDGEFKKQRGDMDKAARKVIGTVTAHDVLRHQTEVALAELLSNPRLHAALSVRLK